GSGFREIQFHSDAVGIVEKELRVAGAWHDALTELYILRVQPLAQAFDIRRGKGDVVEAPGVLIFLLGAADHDTIPRLSRAHQVHRRGAARIKPVAGEIERRAVADLEPEHGDIEFLGALEVLWLDREMLQSAKWHWCSPCCQTKVRSASAPSIQAPTVSKW